MNCETVRSKLYDLLFDLLDESEASEIAAHLAACPACREAHAAALRERGLLARWAVPPPPPGLADQTIAAATQPVEAASSRFPTRQDAASTKEEHVMTYQPIEPELKWLGGRRFWMIAAAAVLLVVAGLGADWLRVASRHAKPQEAFLYGQPNLTPGLPAAWRVYVRNGVTAAPIPNATVRATLVAAGRRVWVSNVTTDANGMADLQHDVPADQPEGSYTLKVEATSSDGESEVAQSGAVKRSFRVLVTTDRPIYQPGHVIHIRSLALASADLRPVAGRDVTLEVRDAKGNKVFKRPLKTSAYGIAAADFELADQVNTGSYTVAATIGDTASERNVTVERYVLPKFKIELTADQGFYAPGAVIKGDLSAQYTFGKPVAGGKVRVTASEFVEKFREFASAEGQTDAEGRFHFEIPLKSYFVGQERKKGDAFITLEAAVTDRADHVQKKSLDLTVTTQPIRIELFPESGELVQGVENVLYVVTAYPDGRPAKTRLTFGANVVQASGLHPKPATGTVAPPRETLTTSALGIAKVKITPTKQELQLTVAAEDERGVRAEVTRRLPVGERTESFLLRTDKAVYRAGETARLTLLSADRAGRIFLDLVKDRRTILMQAVDMKDGRGELALDLPTDLFGTIELHAYRILRDGNILGDTRLIQVNRPDALAISAELDKATYRPAEKALLKLAVTRAGGEPAQAALGLAGVDEAVFALQEMRPGLERVYFAIQEDLLKPRFEICAHAPVTPAQAVQPPPKPNPELDEATVVLFSAAKGGELPKRQPSETFQQKQVRFEAAKREYAATVWDGVALIPSALFVFSLLPLLVLGAAKLFRRTPIQNAPGEQIQRLRRATARTILWWLLGFYLPILGVLVLVILREVGIPAYVPVAFLILYMLAALARAAFSKGPSDGEALHILGRGVVRVLRSRPFLYPVAIAVGTLGILVSGLGLEDLELITRKWRFDLGGRHGHGDDIAIPMACLLLAILALAKLWSWARRLRRCEAAAATPLLRKVVRLLPWAYLLAAVSVVSIAIGADHSHSFLRYEWAVLALIVMGGGLALLVPGALSVAGNAAARAISTGRCIWLGLSRPLFSALPLLVAGFLLPALAPAREEARRVGLRTGREMMSMAAGPMPTRVAKMARPAELPTPSPVEARVVEGGGELKAPARIRRDFPETLLWRPELITDEKGRASLEVPLADSITTWRLAMSAVSARGELGAATAGIRVFQDFFVDVDFPAALTQHDLVSVPVAVYNYLDKPQDVRLDVEEAPWFALKDSPSKTLRIGPREVTSVYFQIEARTPGQHSLTVKAHGSAMADAVERVVRVEPDGRAVVQTINGSLSDEVDAGASGSPPPRGSSREWGASRRLEVAIPADAIDGANDLIVKIYPGAFSQVVEGLESVFQMPHGCFEQTSSTTYPSVLALDYLRRTKQAKPEVEMKALNFINLGYQRLVSFEVSGGGFDWFGRAPANVALTAYGLMEFSDMARVYDVDRAVIERTRRWLAAQQQSDGSWLPSQLTHVSRRVTEDASLHTTAYVAWALAESGDGARGLDSALARIARAGGEARDAYTLTLCANALVAAKRPEAAALLDRLETMKRTNEQVDAGASGSTPPRGSSRESGASKSGKDKAVHWSSTSEGVTHSRGNCLDIETTALAAYAYIRANHKAEVAHQALAWLVEQKDPRGTWHSTQATVHAMRALLAGTGPSGAAEGDLHVTIAANGKLAQELEITPETSDVFRLVSLRPFVQKGQNSIALETSMYRQRPAGSRQDGGGTSGKGNLAYQIVATHYVPWPKTQPKEDKPISIDVQYETTTLKKDDLLTCRVTASYNRPGSAAMTILDLGIPPGFDVLPDAFEALVASRTIERYSMTGRQITVYLSQLEQGKPLAFTYRLRARFPLRVQTPRSAVYPYYQPEVRDEAAPVTIQVM